MMFQAIGACVLMRLMRTDRPSAPTDWLLFGPTDPEVIDDEAEQEPAFLLAAE